MAEDYTAREDTHHTHAVRRGTADIILICPPHPRDSHAGQLAHQQPPTNTVSCGMMGEIATTIDRERRISPTCVHIKISGRKRVSYFYSSCPMVCCGVVSTLFLSLSSSVDYVFFLLARHSPSKLGLCSCFGRQLFSGRSCRTTSAVRHISDSWRALSSFSSPTR